jgi:hypothetical protein
VKLDGAQADLVEGARRALNAASAEEPEQLLGAVRGESQPDDQPKSQECDFH